MQITPPYTFIQEIKNLKANDFRFLSTAFSFSDSFQLQSQLFLCYKPALLYNLTFDMICLTVKFRKTFFLKKFCF